MATDFTYGGKQILSSGPFRPSGKDMPNDARTRVEVFADIASIPTPFVGMKITVLVDETNNNKMTDYIVKSLKANSFGAANSLIDEVVRYTDYLGVSGGNSSSGSGEGLTSEQAQQLQTAYQHSQSPHVTTDNVSMAVRSYVNDNISLLKGDKGDAGANGVDGRDGLTTAVSVNGNTYTHDNGTITLPNYPTVPTKTSQLTNDSSFATESYVTTKIAEASLSGGEVDLSGYATTSQVTELKATMDSLHDIANEYVSSGGTVVQFSNDVNGEPINCHGMGILYYNGVYYAYGESKTGTTSNGFIPTTGINCYSSTDLINWKFENKVIKPNKSDSSSIIHTSKIMERPKCVYNKKNNNFVLFWHADNSSYSFSQIGFATCDTPTGDFTVLGSARPTTVATTCRDFTVFVDDDDKAYAFISQDNNSNMYAHLLNDDYTGFTTTYAQVIGNRGLREAPAVFKYNGEYYILSSGCTGWNPNPSKIHKSSTILGTYTEQNNPCKNDTNSNSYGSQSTYVIKVDPNKFNCEYIACFDRWNSSDLESSTYLWLPLTIDESDNKFYVDNVNNSVIQHSEAVKNKHHIISDPNNYFFNKTIDQALQILLEMIKSSSPVVATAIKVSPSSATVYTGKSATFTCNVIPVAATSNTSVEWSVNNGNASIVTNGKTCTLTGVTTGSVILTATAGALTSSATITIETSTAPANRVFAINANSYNAESNTLTDLDGGLVATLNGTPTISDGTIRFTTSDTFNFDISSLGLTDFTLKMVFRVAVNNSRFGNIITLGDGTWSKSYTLYNKFDKLIFNIGSVTTNGTTVGGTDMSGNENSMGSNVEVNTDIEIVLSYNKETRAVRVWRDGVLTQDGALNKETVTSLSKLCNTEGNTRFDGAYKLIEIYNVYNEDYPS